MLANLKVKFKMATELLEVGSGFSEVQFKEAYEKAEKLGCQNPLEEAVKYLSWGTTRDLRELAHAKILLNEIERELHAKATK